MNPFSGTGVALVTPFTRSLEIDFNALEHLITHVVSNRIDYLVVLGTTGENPVIDEKERTDLLKFVVEKNAGRVPVVLGIGGNDTRKVVHQLEGDLPGVDAILSVAPYYNKPNQQALFSHFETVAAASPLPLILYNVPGRTGCNMTASTTLKLAHESENIVGIKEASGNLSQIMEIIQFRPQEFSVISGDDALTLPLIAAGADGVISVVANAFPEVVTSMVNDSLRGDFATARAKHYPLMEFTDMIFAEGSPAGVKAALKAMNICDDYIRQPLVPVTSQLNEAICREVSKIKSLNLV